MKHDEGIAGSEDAWIAVIGPDTPDVGEAENRPDAHLAGVAATMLQILGLDWREFDPSAAPPIAGAVGAARAAGAGKVGPPGFEPGTN